MRRGLMEPTSAAASPVEGRRRILRHQRRPTSRRGPGPARQPDPACARAVRRRRRALRKTPDFPPDAEAMTSRRAGHRSHRRGARRCCRARRAARSPDAGVPPLVMAPPADDLQARIAASLLATSSDGVDAKCPRDDSARIARAGRGVDVAAQDAFGRVSRRRRVASTRDARQTQSEIARQAGDGATKGRRGQRAASGGGRPPERVKRRRRAPGQAGPDGDRRRRVHHAKAAGHNRGVFGTLVGKKCAVALAPTPRPPPRVTAPLRDYVTD